MNVGVPPPHVFLSRLLRMPDLTVRDSEVRTHVLTIATEDDRPRVEAIQEMFGGQIVEVEEEGNAALCRGTSLWRAWGHPSSGSVWEVLNRGACGDGQG